MADGEAEPDTVARIFGREEWLEYAMHDVRRNADTGVADRDPHRVAIVPAADRDGVFVRSALGNGMDGICEQVDKHLREPTLVREHAARRVRFEDETRAYSALVIDEAERGIERAADIHEIRRCYIRPRE